MQDTAAVTQCLWKYWFDEQSKDSMSDSLGLNIKAAEQWVMFIVGMHDLGKASWWFQAKWDALRPWLTEKHLKPAKRFLEIQNKHGLVTAAVFPYNPSFSSRPIDIETLKFLAKILGGHHGLFPSPTDLHNARRYLSVAELDTEWGELRHILANELGAITLDETTNVPLLKINDPWKNPFAMTLAGLTCLADWIASNETWFPYASHIVDPTEYWSLAIERASRAVDQLGFRGWAAPKNQAGFKELFPHLSQPMRPLQQSIVNLTRSNDSSTLVIIEAPMGEGKTEAALMMQDHWIRSKQQQGAYIALPTMATSNQMFERFKDFLKHRYQGVEVDLHLLHSHALLSEDYQQIRSIEPDGGDGLGAVLAREWFTGRKRGLLAPFAVGTVDQALMSVLLVRHGFLRLLGLAGKTLVFDEVHAYDAYMLRLFERLLAWLGRLGTTVIILSATLPTARRKAFLNAYGGKEIDLPESTYPRITTIDNSACVHIVKFKTRPWSDIAVQWVEDDVANLSSKLEELLVDGGTVGWICNTVKRSQGVYAKLAKHFGGSQVQIDLFHARYPFAERDRREKEVLKKYGKHRQVKQPSILVATQVIEQSLDLDFDLMVTELAPADLVLQRAGRLQRHERTRSGYFSQRMLWILKPEGHDDNCPHFGYTVYEHYILLRSWLALRSYQKIRIPEDIEPIIESVYEDQDFEISQSLQDHMSELKSAFDSDLRKKILLAEQITLHPPDYGDVTTQWNKDLDEDNPDVHQSLQVKTRLGNPSVTVVCLHQLGDGLYLDPEGIDQVDLTRPPDFEMSKKLIGASVSLSYWGCLKDFHDSEIPPGWRKSSMMRFYRKAVFVDGLCHTSTRILRLDAQMGVMHESLERGGEDNESDL